MKALQKQNKRTTITTTPTQTTTTTKTTTTKEVIFSIMFNYHILIFKKLRDPSFAKFIGPWAMILVIGYNCFKSYASGRSSASDCRSLADSEGTIPSHFENPVPSRLSRGTGRDRDAAVTRKHGLFKTLFVMQQWKCKECRVIS